MSPGSSSAEYSGGIIRFRIWPANVGLAFAGAGISAGNEHELFVVEAVRNRCSIPGGSPSYVSR